ncbi:hypothetical protein CERZMDRAFT_96025 [Cercospora zeae-maydis SCOH1-5]|uniref:Life-span regulatory factor domain-containing protein n=1 Tax=Cercospora zeae-maydis SCOH1-5 TaxID=717836 RepID=A0A6A6FKK7_9PEZI|nr:hypothetical protein CERZMDRAFT_96025 [Cercospora zeae-maydis SCOH1-5]
MTPRHHARQPSQGRKLLPPHARPTRPAPLTQRKSYNHAQSNLTPQPSPKRLTSSGSSTKAGADHFHSRDDDDESGMASFLQFCTTCEKQILTPDSSILYCSEICRRRDSRPTSLQEIQSIQHSIHSPPPLSATNSYFDHPIPDIVPQRSPTVLRPMSRTFSDFSIADLDDTASDHDSRDICHESEAWDHHDHLFLKQHRPRTKRSSTTSTGTRSRGDSSTNPPSLSHSPGSSYGTVASNASSRPVIRHNPFSTTSSRKSVELVIPYPIESTSPTQLLKDASLKSSASTLTQFKVAEVNNYSYEAPLPGSRRCSRERADQSLKQLFSHDAMKSSPRHG